MVEQISYVFKSKLPAIDYRSLGGASVRNRLLAHFLIENLDSRPLRELLRRNSSPTCVSKMCLADETSNMIGRYIIRLAKYDSDDSRYDQEKAKQGLGSLNPRSSIDKYIAICGVKMYRAMHPLGPLVYSKLKPKKEPKLAPKLHFLTQGVSDGAVIEHAANCYLTLFDEEAKDFDMYGQRIQHAETKEELRRILCTRLFHERTPDEELQEHNTTIIQDLDIPMDLVFFQAVQNWNVSVMKRLL
ncbi:hypothetical protein ACFL0V_07450 [Nanoarchaeota archaeon]